jgi:hypothetical protein
MTTFFTFAAETTANVNQSAYDQRRLRNRNIVGFRRIDGIAAENPLCAPFVKGEKAFSPFLPVTRIADPFHLLRSVSKKP